jgi:hypothetical protein
MRGANDTRRACDPSRKVTEVSLQVLEALEMDENDELGDDE